MYALRLKKWLRNIRLPDRHSLAYRLRRITYDQRFWPLIIGALLTAVLISFLLSLG